MEFSTGGPTLTRHQKRVQSLAPHYVAQLLQMSAAELRTWPELLEMKRGAVQLKRAVRLLDRELKKRSAA